MVYISRKILYSVFIVFFSIVFFSIVFLFSFDQALEVSNASVEVSGDKIIFKANIDNISNRAVRNPFLLIKIGDLEINEKIKDLKVGENFEFIKELPFSEDLQYEIFVNAPFNKPIRLFFELEEATVRPVTAKVHLNSNMVVGNKYDVVVSLCNSSNNDLFDVTWFEQVDGKFFEESFVLRSTSLSVNQCKNLYSTLTPIVPGDVKMTFLLKVGSLEQRFSHSIKIVEGN